MTALKKSPICTSYYWSKCMNFTLKITGKSTIVFLILQCIEFIKPYLLSLSYLFFCSDYWTFSAGFDPIIWEKAFRTAGGILSRVAWSLGSTLAYASDIACLVLFAISPTIESTIC